MTTASSARVSKDISPTPNTVSEPGLSVWLALQGEDIPVADRLTERQAAILAAYCVFQKGDDAELFDVKEARQWAFDIRKTNPMAWGASRQGDFMRFVRVTRANGGPALQPHVLQHRVDELLRAGRLSLASKEKVA